MSKNPKIHVFTDKTLREHNVRIAAAVHQATVWSTMRKASRMNAGQLLNASRDKGRSVYWSPEKLEKLVSYIEKD